MKHESRFVHLEGITDITLTPDGKKIITCGSDSDIRVYENYNDSDPIQFSTSDSCLGMVAHGDKVIVATENNTVELLELPKGKSLGHRIKFTGAANHVDISKDGKTLIAGSADMTIQVVQIDNKSAPPVKIDKAHSAPILAIAIDPLSEFFASSGCDGHVCVWSFKNPKKLVKKWTDVFPHSNDITTSSTLCRMAWNPDLGQHLAVPSKEKIILYNREDWEEVKALSCPKLTKFFSVVRYSLNSSYIAAGGVDGTIVIWDGITYSQIATIKEKNHITGLTFNSDSDQLYCTDVGGSILCIQEFTTMYNSSDISSEVAAVTDTNGTKTSSEKNDGAISDGDDVFNDGMDGLFDDDDGDNVISITKIKADVGFVDDEFVGVKKAKSALANNGATVKDDDDDDARSVSSAASSKLSRPPQAYMSPVVVNPFTEQQKPFQPSSTPDYLTHRFMIWNNVGLIRSDEAEDEEFNEDSLEIEFHDRGFHNPIILNNQSDYTIGNVSKEVVALACPRTSEHASKLLCVNFSTWNQNNEWTMDMPDKEEIIGIALGTGWIAVGTTEHRLRLFSIGGVQKYVYDIPGPFVALSAFENLLFITYHFGVGINGNQSIYYAVLKITANGSRMTPLIMDVPLPLSPKGVLTWIGFTDEGTPALADSKNIVRLLNGRLWSPFCHMKAGGSSDHYWVVGVSEGSNQIRAIRCLGSQFPPTVPKPNVMILEVKIPLCEMDTEKSKLEDAMLQSFSTSAIAKKMEKKGLDVDECKDTAETDCITKLFKLFVLACDAGQDFRATEYVRMMPTAHAMQLAIKYASKLTSRHALIERLQDIGRRKLQAEEDQDDEVVDDVDDFEANTIVTHVEYRRPSSSITESTDAYDGPRSSSSGVNIPVIIEDNPLMRRQKEEIRSIISKVPMRRNPFKKGSTVSQNVCGDAANGSELGRQNSSTSMSRQDSFMEDSETVKVNGTDSENSIGFPTASSKGLNKIDAWNKPVDKPVTLPEFSLKNPDRKSAGEKRGRKNPFEKKTTTAKRLKK